jgi:hypothetical protein
VSAVLARCQSEQNYYSSLGALVWFNSLLAGAGMTLMLEQQAGEVSWQVVAGGAFWSLCVLNLDRFLLIATGEAKGWKRLMPVGRILLSLCLAIIIGEHVVQFLFRNEINNQRVQEQLDAQRTNYTKARAGFPEADQILEEKGRKQAEIDRKQAEVNRLRDDYIHEAEGTAGSGIIGKGPLFEEKERDYRAAAADRKKLDEEMKAIDARLESVNQQIAGVASTANAAKAGDRGFLANHHALFGIIKGDPTLLFLYLVISSAMILFEITPLATKLGGKGKMHDSILQKEYELKQAEQEETFRAEVARLRREAADEGRSAEKLSQLHAETLDEVIASVRNDTHASLSPDKSALAEAVRSQVLARVASRLGPPPSVAKDAPAPKGEAADAGAAEALNPEASFSVPVYVNGEEEETAFTLVFRGAREKILGRDLVYSLAGLGRQRPADVAPHVQFHECRLSNARGDTIEPDEPLFAQIGGDGAVYLSPFEPTVSDAEN